MCDQKETSVRFTYEIHPKGQVMRSWVCLTCLRHMSGYHGYISHDFPTYLHSSPEHHDASVIPAINRLHFLLRQGIFRQSFRRVVVHPLLDRAVERMTQKGRPSHSLMENDSISSGWLRLPKTGREQKHHCVGTFIVRKCIRCSIRLCGKQNKTPFSKQRKLGRNIIAYT